MWLTVLDYSSDMDDPSVDDTDDSAANSESGNSHTQCTPDENSEVVSSTACALKSDRSITTSSTVLVKMKADVFAGTKQKVPLLSAASTTQFGAV